MTYFLNGGPVREISPPASAPDITPTGILAGVGAGFQKAALENDANLRVSREKSVEYEGMSLKAGERLGVKTVYDEGLKRGLFPKAAKGNIAPPKSVRELMDQDWRAGALILELGRAQAAADPAKWADLDLTDEGVDKRVNERLRAEHNDLEQTLAAMPSGQWAAEFIGSMAGMTADVKNLPFLVAGGGAGGSLLKVFGREALLNTAAEAVNMPAQFGMAERLDIPDPNPVVQLSTAALAGGAIGVVAEGLPRALSYFSGRNRVVTPPGVNAATHEVAVEVAEDAIATGQNPLEAVQRVLDDLPVDEPVQPAAPPDRAPLIPPAAREATPPADMGNPITPPVEPVSTPPLPDNATLAETLQGEADAMRKGAIGNRKLPLLTSLKRAGIRINPDSPEGQTLRSMGVTARTMPGLFSRKGRSQAALDNMVASDWEERLPGIWDATNTPRGTDGAYLDLNGVMDVIRRELAGDLNWIRPVAEANQLDRDAEDILRGVYDTPSIVQDFVSGRQADDGLYFQNPNLLEEPGYKPFQSDIDDARRRVAQYLFNKRIRDVPEDVLDEIAVELATYGGDAKFLIERATFREIGELDRLYGGGENGSERAAVGGRAEGGRNLEPPQRDTTGPGAAGGSSGQSGGVENTSAGVQYVAPGIAPVSDRARLEAAQSRPLEGGNIPMDVGLFDTGARAQMDMFADPFSPKARAAQDAMIRDLQDSIDTDGDFTVDLGDGKGGRSVASLIRELDDDDAFNEVLDACRAGRTE